MMVARSSKHNKLKKRLRRVAPRFGNSSSQSMPLCERTGPENQGTEPQRGANLAIGRQNHGASTSALDAMILGVKGAPIFVSRTRPMTCHLCEFQRRTSLTSEP